MDDSFSFLAIIGFLMLSAFFSGSETAFFSLSKVQQKKFEKGKSKSEKRIHKLLKNPRELLIIILLGNTIVNVAAASTSTLIAISIAEKYFKHQISDTAVLAIEIGLVTTLLLIFGEITPKLIAFSSPEKVAIFSSFILMLMKYILWPVIKLLELISSLFSSRKSLESSSNLTSEDFRNLIKSKAAQSSLEEKEKKIISSILRFSSTIAREIMIPRVDIISVEDIDGLSEVRRNIIESGHSKIPIFHNNIDNIIGVIYAKDLILNPNKNTLNAYFRPPLFITENTKIQNLLNQFKSHKIQIAIVVDEYGGTSGLITLEDILEELVGEILDEYDKEKSMISQESQNEYLINGMYSIAELNEEFELNIDNDEFDNLADFLYDHFNRVPKRNESFVYEDKVIFTITNIKGHRIQYAKMQLLNLPDEEDA
ncbi:MAG: hemolysin family protein [Candidatus Cloacimonadales bacterium]|nr:hemolysin family protein [Candidatus Cloacimonadales bacterium]